MHLKTSLLMNKIKPPYNVNQLTQEVALKAIQNQQQRKKEVMTIVANRSLLASELQKISFVKYILQMLIFYWFRWRCPSQI